MSNNHINIIRSGINTTFQDKGRDHLYHIGIPFSGAMDNRNFLIANKLVNNNLNSAVIEFAYQGPHIKYLGEKINTTGDEKFPYISKSGALFFSSNGHTGMGGLDIFRSELKDEGKEPNIWIKLKMIIKMQT